MKRTIFLCERLERIERSFSKRIGASVATTPNFRILTAANDRLSARFEDNGAAAKTLPMPPDPRNFCNRKLSVVSAVSISTTDPISAFAHDFNRQRLSCESFLTSKSESNRHVASSILTFVIPVHCCELPAGELFQSLVSAISTGLIIRLNWNVQRL